MAVTVYDFDGYEDYGTAGILREHSRKNGSPTIDTGGRNGGHKLTCPGNATIGSSGYVCRHVAAAPTSIVIGQYLTATTLTTPIYVFDFRDVNNVGNVLVRINANGSIEALREASTGYLSDFSAGGTNAVSLGISSAGVIGSGVGYSIVVDLTIHGSAGAITIYKDGVAVLTVTGANTMAAGSTIVDILMGCYSSTAGSSVTFDDFWASDSNLGDMRVDTHYPTSEGSYHQSSPSGGSNRALMVDEQGEPDDATTFNEFAAGNVDTFQHDAFINSGASIVAAMSVIDAEKVTVGTAKMKHALLIGGVNYESAEFTLAGTWGRDKRIVQVNPATSVEFTEAQFNAAQPGAHRTV